MIMQRLWKRNQKDTKGFTLIELAIVLAVTSLLAVGLWRMMSAGNSQLRDQSTADQQKDLIKAVRGYLASQEGYAFLSDSTKLSDPPYTLTLPAAAGACAAPFAGFCNFLPDGFDAATTNPYGQTYGIQVARHVHTDTSGNPVLDGYSFMIKTNSSAGEAIPDTSGGRISSMIGNDGGFVYAATVCGAAGVTACGAYGSWSAAPVADYSFGAVASGEVATRTYVGMNASLNTPWLARQDIAGDALMNGVGDFNTIQTNTSLGGHTLWGNGSDGSTGGTVEMMDGFINMYRVAKTGINPAIVLTDNCTSAERSMAGSCNDIMTVTGNSTFTGLSKFEYLYASKFIYDAALSDRRLKEDITPLTGVLAKFSKMGGYSFLMKATKEKKYGVIAQEVEKVFPEVVHEVGEAYKGVDYIGLVGPLVAAVNELRSQNEAMKKEIEQLKTQIKDKNSQ